MFRSTTNLLGQLTTAVLMDRWVGAPARGSSEETSAGAQVGF
jgi:Na+/H+-dicarboxylate symporter